MFKFLNDKSDLLAKSMAQQLAKDLPVNFLDDSNGKFSVSKVSRSVDRSISLAVDFHKSNRPGLIQRARLANNFKWELKSLGYPKEFIDVATEALVIELTKV